MRLLIAVASAAICTMPAAAQVAEIAGKNVTGPVRSVGAVEPLSPPVAAPGTPVLGAGGEHLGIVEHNVPARAGAGPALLVRGTDGMLHLVAAGRFEVGPGGRIVLRGPATR